MIYVVSHKQVEMPFKLGKEYRIIQVGNREETFGDVRDNTCDNIAEKNGSYCELTALYWLWKNCTDDYIGIDHYRRFFNNTFSYGHVIDDATIRKILRKYDVIVSFNNKLGVTVKEDYCSECGYEKDLIQLRNVIADLYPEYVPEFDEVFNGHSTYFYNMMIASQQVFTEYCKWLFNILFEVEKRIDISNYDAYHKRIFGFMAERLLTIYVQHNNLTPYQCGIVMTGEPWSVKKKILTGLKRKYYSLRQF